MSIKFILQKALLPKGLVSLRCVHTRPSIGADRTFCYGSCIETVVKILSSDTYIARISDPVFVLLMRIYFGLR